MESNKRPKTETTQPTPLPSSVVCSFQNGEGERTSALDIPTISSTKQLEALVNTLLNNVDYLPYAFYVNDVEIVSSLEDTVRVLVSAESKLSLEDVLSISYQPLSVYRVRPVTRCSETMPGHTDAVRVIATIIDLLVRFMTFALGFACFLFS
jgi:ribosome assembly protein 4